MPENFDDFADALNDALEMHGPAVRVALAADLGALIVAVHRVRRRASVQEREDAWSVWEKDINSMWHLAREITETTSSERQRTVDALRQLIRETGIVAALDSLPLADRTGDGQSSADVAVEGVILRLATELGDRSNQLEELIKQARKARTKHEAAVKALADEAKRATTELEQSNATLDTAGAIQKLFDSAVDQQRRGHRWRLAGIAFAVVGLGVYLPLTLLHPSPNPTIAASRFGVLVALGAIGAYCDRQGREHRWMAHYYHYSYLRGSAFMQAGLDPKLIIDLVLPEPPFEGFPINMRKSQPGPLGTVPGEVPEPRRRRAAFSTATPSDAETPTT